MNPDEPTVDRFVRTSVIVVQTLLAVLYVIPGVVQEFRSDWPDITTHDPFQVAGGPIAWILLGVLAAVLIAALWERWRTAELVGSLLLAASTACFVAGRFASQLAVGSALRWGLALAFLASSLLIWQRQRLLPWCRRAKMGVALDFEGAHIARTTLLAVTVWPVFGLTFLATVLQLNLVESAGPVTGTFFDCVGPNTSYLLPLVLVVVGLIGFAVREGSTGYAFSAGLVVQLAASVVVCHAKGTMQLTFDQWGLWLVQVNIIVASAWRDPAGGGDWLIFRPVWSSPPHRLEGRKMCLSPYAGRVSPAASSDSGGWQRPVVADAGIAAAGYASLSAIMDGRVR